MRAPATNTHVTRVSRLKTRAPQSGHRTCTPATNTAQTPKQIPLSHAHTPESWQPCPPMSHPANGSIMRVVCGSLLRESIAHPPPLVRPRRRFCLSSPPPVVLQTMVSSSPIVRVKSLVFLLASSLPSAFVCVCVCAFSMSRHSLPASRTWSPASPHGVIKSKVIVCALKL